MTKIKHSQNFLKSKKLVNKLIENSNLNSEDIVIEIGPGKGIITKQLSNKVKKVLAIEADKKLYAKLILDIPQNVEYFNEDFLDFPLPKEKNYKVFSNIPFNLTSDIIRKLTDNLDNLPSDIYLIMQEEAAKKYLGMPYQKYEGFKASSIKSLYDISKVYEFKKHDFFPKPNVNSVLVHFKRKNHFNKKDYKDFLDFLSFFYLKKKGESTKKQLTLLFTPKQIRRLSNDFKFNLEDSFTKLNNNQWEGIYEYSKIGLDNLKKEKYRGSYKKLQKIQGNLRKQRRTNLRHKK